MSVIVMKRPIPALQITEQANIKISIDFIHSYAHHICIDLYEWWHYKVTSARFMYKLNKLQLRTPHYKEPQNVNEILF